MASKGKDIFVMPEEFAKWMHDLTGSPLHEHLVLRYFSREELIHWDQSDEALLAASQVKFTGEQGHLDGITQSNYIPGKLGWVSLDVPRLQGNILYGVTLAGKSDWWDSDLQMSLEKKDAILRYDRIWRCLKSRLNTHVGIEHLPSRNREPVTGWAYSAGAEAWYRQGGLLRQKGNNYSNFFPLEPAEVEAIKAKKRAASKKNTR